MSIRLLASVALSSCLLAACGSESPDSSSSPASTVDSGVDARDGGADTSSTRKCAGTVTPCSLLATSQCDAAVGCFVTKGCEGSATPCALLSKGQCSSQQGCLWSSSSEYCSGAASSCGLLSTYTCGSQDGCSLRETCEGVALACDMLTAERCADTPGCRID